VIVFNWSDRTPADRFLRFALPTVSHRKSSGSDSNARLFIGS
jgi:hypothetical protein